MNDCGPIESQMAFYLDDELRDQERADFELHLERCYRCRQRLEQEQGILRGVRAARPLYEAPPELKKAVIEILARAPAPQLAPEGLRRRIQRHLTPKPVGRARRWRRSLMALAAALLLALFTVVWYVTLRQPRQPQPSEFALMAVATHLRHQRGQLPLEIVSGSPDEISRWFVGKVPFDLRLPNYQESSGQDKLYRLEGARLVAFKNDYAACITYEMQQQQITLVITSNSVARPEGGEVIKSNGLTFHHDSINGLKVNTWTDRGLTYALVSNLAERGQQSCIVCHAGTKDRSFIEGLSPARPKL